LWRLLDGLREENWTDAIDMAGAQVAVADYCPNWWPAATRLLIRRVRLDAPNPSGTPPPEATLGPSRCQHAENAQQQDHSQMKKIIRLLLADSGLTVQGQHRCTRRRHTPNERCIATNGLHRYCCTRSDGKELPHD
jgi:hypothetical protein